MSIQTTIAASVDTLPPSLARIARAVADNPTRVIDSTITELATSCDTSVASVVRFCRAIGVPGYAELRRALAAEIGRESVNFGSNNGFGAEIAAEDSLRDAAGKIAALERLAIEETVERLDYDALGAAAEAIESSGRILLFGIGASRLAASDLGHKLLRIGLNAIALEDAHEAAAAASLLVSPTVAIGFSHSGTTPETVHFLRAARASGATTVGVTGSSTSPLAAAADLALTTHARESRFRAGAMVSRIAQLALVDCLFIGAAQLRRDVAVDALARSAAATGALRGD